MKSEPPPPLPPPPLLPQSLTRSGGPLQALVVDDHALIRLGVRHLLGERAQVFEAATLAQARQLLDSQPFDLMLFDLGLGEDFGLAALPRLRAAHPALKIIVLTSMAESLYAERCLRAGADGYLMKSALAEQLQAALDTVLAGQIYVSPGQGSALLRRLTGQEPAVDGAPVLSSRELEVLRLVATGLGTRQIAEVLNRSVKTIESHKQALKTKLGADTPARLVRLAVGWFGESA